MTIPILALVLLASAGLGMAGARGLLSLRKGLSTSISVAVCVSYILIILWRPDILWVSNLSILLAGVCLGFLFGLLLSSAASVLAFLTTAVVGVTDIAILAAAYLGLRKATDSEWEPAVWLLIGLLSAFFVGIFLSGVPGLPFLAAGGYIFVFRHSRRRAPN